jgi:hypothetical protein
LWLARDVSGIESECGEDAKHSEHLNSLMIRGRRYGKSLKETGYNRK